MKELNKMSVSKAKPKNLVRFTDPCALIDRPKFHNAELVCKWEDKTISASTRDTLDGVPLSRWHRREDGYILTDPVDAVALHDWIEEKVIPFAQPLFDAYRTEWKNDHIIGSFPGFEEEKRLFDSRMIDQESLPMLSGAGAGIWDAEDFLLDIPSELPEFPTTDQIEKSAEFVASQARKNHNIVIWGGVAAIMNQIRNLMREGA